MKTSWKRTLGMILSTGLFIIPLGAYATLGSVEEAVTASQTAAAPLGEGQGDSIPGDGGSDLTRIDLTGEDKPSTAPEGATAPEVDGAVADSRSADDSEAVAADKARDKATQTDVLLEKANDADKQANPDTTAEDEEDETEKVNINTATEDELVEGLKGIGPSKAREIIKYREKNGPFKKIDQLKKVKGIGPSTYASIKPQLEI
ncbi:helix-hairpin-helix domain-containing protein [Acerihabitans sp. KWT182]|uniref:Helix-hairpin-helix domain-containing protein n=1 Tax=Acerihabitans sp. KWT182 TaxID=3157919 RepID=A0AAU7QCR3_9GAMM